MADYEYDYELMIITMVITLVPSRAKALNDLIAAHEQGERPGMENALGHLCKDLAHFVKAAVELDLDL